MSTGIKWDKGGRGMGKLNVVHNSNSTDIISTLGNYEVVKYCLKHPIYLVDTGEIWRARDGSRILFTDTDIHYLDNLVTFIRKNVKPLRLPVQLVKAYCKKHNTPSCIKKVSEKREVKYDLSTPQGYQMFINSYLGLGNAFVSCSVH